MMVNAKPRMLTRALAAFAAMMIAAIALMANPSSAYATLVGDKWNVQVGDDVLVFEVLKVTMYGEQGTVRLCAFQDGGEPTRDLEIPSQVLGAEGNYPVTAIGPYVFSGQDLAGDQYLESVTIADSVESIDAYAFNNCRNLVSVNFGSASNLKEICGYAFHNCGVDADAPGALAFPASLEDIKQDAFSDSAFSGPLVIPDSVTHIGADAFANCPNFTSLSIGSGLTSLSNGAFQGCSGLDGPLTIPTTVTAVNDWVFRDCAKITQITMGNALTTIGEEAFKGCTALTATVIPASVTTFGKYAFADCTALSDLSFADGLAKIGVLAFNGCTALTSVTVPNSVTLIDTRAFDSCSNLESVTFGSGLKTIGTGAFQYCGKLKSATIPDSVTKIGAHAFNQCRALSTLHIGSGVTTIGTTAFQYCESLTAVSIPAQVTTIDTYTFFGCTSLASVTFPAGLTRINEKAFDFCESLSSLNLPDSVTYIGKYAFYGCTSLTSLELPAKLQTVAGQAFDGCTGLTGKTLSLPASLTAVYNQSFGNRCFAKIVNNSDTSFDHSSFLKPDEGDSFYADSSGAKATSLGKGTYTLASSFKASIADAEITGLSSKVYNGKAQTQNPTVKIGATTLKSGTDYTLSYENNTNAGTATIVVTGAGAYIGTKTATFAIGKAASSIKLAAQSKTYTGKALAYSGKVTKSGSSGKATYSYYSDAKCKKAVKAANVKDVGVYYVKATVAADANHNAATSAAAKLIVNPKGTTLKSAKASAGGFIAKWGKQAKQVTGYQLMYATNAKFTKGKKTIGIAKAATVSKKVSGLKANTKYYVKVRTYKKVGSAKYYSAWSTVKTVTTPAKASALAAQSGL